MNRLRRKSFGKDKGNNGSTPKHSARDSADERKHDDVLSLLTLADDDDFRTSLILVRVLLPHSSLIAQRLPNSLI